MFSSVKWGFQLKFIHSHSHFLISSALKFSAEISGGIVTIEVNLNFRKKDRTFYYNLAQQTGELDAYMAKYLVASSEHSSEEVQIQHGRVRIILSHVGRGCRFQMKHPTLYQIQFNLYIVLHFVILQFCSRCQFFTIF